MSSIRLVYGGTFDPVHNGHLAVARAAREALQADCVHFLPCGDPPHRSRPVASAAHRVAMLQIALAGDSSSRIDTREMNRVGPSYTVETLRELRAELGPSACIVLLLGRDAADGLASWHAVADLPSLTNLLIMARPGHPGEQPEQSLGWRSMASAAALASCAAGCVAEIPQPVSAASSTAVRRRSDAAWQDLPPGVAEYMRRHALYP